MSRRRSSGGGGGRPPGAPPPRAPDSELPSPSSSARRSPQLHPITGEPPSKRKAAARSLRPLQPLNHRPGSAGELATSLRGSFLDGGLGDGDGLDGERRRPSSAQPSSPQESQLGQARELKKLYAARVSYTQQRDRQRETDEEASRQEAARVAAAAVQATRSAAAGEHADLVRRHHAASVIQAAERCRVKCDAYIETRWAAAMIQRVERGRRARRRRRLLEAPPWIAPGMGLAPGLMAAAGDGGDATAGALWRMLFHTAAKMASMRAAEMMERGEGPWGARGAWNGTASLAAGAAELEPEPEPEPEPQLKPEDDSETQAEQADADGEHSGRGSNLHATVVLRSLAAEEEEQARLAAIERSRREAAEARAAVRERRKTMEQEQQSADADEAARQSAANTVQRQWRSRQRQLAADRIIWSATTTVQAAWRGHALRTQLDVETLAAAFSRAHRLQAA